MHKIILTGGPSTGKSTTFNMLREVYPEAHFVEEAAEEVIKQELAKQAADSSYVPVMPVTHYTEFAPLVMQQQLNREAAIPDDVDLAVFDRGLLDNVGYLRHNRLHHLIPEVERHAKLARYTLVFLCERVGEIERTEIRRENDQQALAIHNHLREAYLQTDIPVISLPAVSPEERLAIIQESLDKLISY